MSTWLLWKWPVYIYLWDMCCLDFASWTNNKKKKFHRSCRCDDDDDTFVTMVRHLVSSMFVQISIDANASVWAAQSIHQLLDPKPQHNSAAHCTKPPRPSAWAAGRAAPASFQVSFHERSQCFSGLFKNGGVIHKSEREPSRQSGLFLVWWPTFHTT